MNRPNGILKATNEYQRLIVDYDKIPKAVLAAIAVSALNIAFCEEDLNKVNDALLNEWKILHSAGVIPQKPIREVTARLDDPDEPPIM
jgi:hypothetical protein